MDDREAQVSGRVSYEVQEGIALLTVDNPAVNTLSSGVRRTLVEGLERAEADDAVGAIVLIGAGRGFCAGADITEFASPPQDPWVPDLCNRVEAATKPVVAALHGMALGGGFELALAAHYRVAVPDAMFGLPEVSLGLLPGAGGTQRAPRLAGAELSLDLMLSGKPIRADDPRAGVFFDAVIEGDLRQGAVAYARDLVAAGAGPRPTRAATAGLSDPIAYQRSIASHHAVFADHPEIARHEIVNCVEAAGLLPFEQGLAFESAAFETLLGSDQSLALRHAFFAERKATKSAGPQGIAPRPVSTIGIVGGGQRGRALGLAVLGAGLRVILVERNQNALDRAMAGVEAVLERRVCEGQLGEAERQARLAGLSGASDLVALEASDLVIETVTDNLNSKLLVFSQLDGVVREGAVLVTTTASGRLARIAEETGSPGDVVGLHLLPDARSARLAEVVSAGQSAADAVATVVALARRLGLIPVRAGLAEGFIGHRVLAACYRAADQMVMAGSTPYLVDAALEAWGMAAGPYRQRDMVGLDNERRALNRLAEAQGVAVRAPGLIDRLCDAGHLGHRAGRGFYLYLDGGRSGSQDPQVIAMIRAERESKGITPRRFSAEDIQRRCLAAMANAGARLLRDGIAQRPSDIDTVMIHGCGFPRWRGGPMMAADLEGLLRVRCDLLENASEDPAFWTPEPLFDDLIKNGRGFDSLNG